MRSLLTGSSGSPSLMMRCESTHPRRPDRAMKRKWLQRKRRQPDGPEATKARDRPGRRVTVYLPGELDAQVRENLPGVNISAVLQEALRQMLDCEHEHLRCADCGEAVDSSAAVGNALSKFWGELLWTWQPLVDRGGTAEGAARVGKEVAVRLGVPRAETQPLPRPTRRAREASTD